MFAQHLKNTALRKNISGITFVLLLAAQAWTQPPERLAVPPSVLAPPWLESRRQAQLATLGDFEVYYDFGFVDQAAASGIDFRNRVVDDSGKAHKPVHYDHGNGLAVADVDGDGLFDLFFVTQVGGNQLWRNMGAGRFENITPAALALQDRISVSASFADIDNDGDPDLYISAVREGNSLFENLGGGRFKDVSAESGLDYRGHSSSAVFFDYDRDGLLDMFLANVGVYTTDEQAAISVGTGHYYVGFTDAFSGHLMPERAEQSILYRNSGGNRFVDVSVAVGLEDVGWSGAASPLDANGDGWPDLYVLNMQGHDQYYENVRGEYFVDKSREVFPRTPWGSMGIQVFDFDNDGRQDIYVTDMHSDMSEDIGPEKEKLKSSMHPSEEFLRSGGNSIFGNAFFRSEGEGSFVEISDHIGAENYWPWGLSTGDFNADGYEDVFITASMNYPYRYGVNSLLLNNRGRGFRDSEFILGIEPRAGGKTAMPWFVLDCVGEDLRHPHCASQSGELFPGKRRERVEVWAALGSRSAAVVDIDRDGDLDIVTNEFNSSPMVLISDLSARKKTLSYVEIELIGSTSNRSGLGATVIVSAEGQGYNKVQNGQSGYLSQSLYPLYFGLGEATGIDRIEVRWPSGKKQVINGPIGLNRLVLIREP
ncbi:MAG TPA: CRTAC1 family protein [Candidatus Latescibacteria bacterium]|nr:CRTAC1 family protein [Candidatus Handelsmanbacteria bacterium]HIL07950.1 CRTAC1 family protein [Candidatus Latescibacterota bacterium]